MQVLIINAKINEPIDHYIMNDRAKCRYRKRDCQELLEGGCHTSGVYTIQPDSIDPFEAGSLSS